MRKVNSDIKNKQRIIFLSFADSSLLLSLKRIKSEAKEFEAFDKIICYTESDFDKSYFMNFKERFTDRGFGYWMWKSYLLKRELEKLNESDIICYSDAGCHFNKLGRSRFFEYINLVSDSKTGVLLFEQSLKESEFTKGDIFDYFNVSDNEDYVNHNQCWAGFIFIKKCNHAMSFINEWFDICHMNYQLITDEKSNKPNFPDFKENRHDQSILSILSVKYNAEKLSANEVWSNDWSTMKDYPIWAMRDKVRVVKIPLIKKIKRIIKRVIFK